MSRIGNKPIKLNEDVDIDIANGIVTVKGPKGELSVNIDNNILVENKDSIIQLKVIDNKDRQGNAKLGLYRSLIQNNIIGVTQGYKKELILQGIGYRVQKNGNNLNFSLGFSHSIEFNAPNGIKLEVEAQTKVFVEGIDKELVGRTCSNIIKLRKRDVYKGKGIYFSGEHIKKKPGKSIKK